MASIDSMSKQEFADFALTQGVTLNISMTKIEMVEDYNKSLGITPAVTNMDGSENTDIGAESNAAAPTDAVIITTEDIRDETTDPTPEEIAAAEAEVARLFAAAQAMNAEEERIANLPVEEQVELVQWTIEEAIGILRYATLRGRNKKPLFQEDKILHLIDEIEESAKL